MKRFRVFIFNTIILMFTGILLRVLAIYFNIYISNKLGSEMLGTFHLIMSIYLFGITLANFGINLSSTRIVSEELALNNKNGTLIVANKCLYFSLFSGLFSGLFFYISKDFLLNNCLHNKVSANIIYLICLALPLISMSNAINGYFAGIRKVYKNSISQLFEQIAKIVITIFLFKIYLPKGIEFSCFALILGDLISEIISFVFIYFLYKFETKYNLGTVTNNRIYNKKILRISLPVAITSYIRSGLSTLKQLIIPSSLEKSGNSFSNALSKYGIINGMALPIIMFPDIFIKSFSNLLIPEFSRYWAKKDFKRIKEVTTLLLTVSSLFSILISIMLFIFSKNLGLKLYNNISAAYYIKMLSPLAFFIYVDTIIDSILRGIDAQVGVMLINILDLIISVSFIFFFVPKLGVSGYLISIYISEIINFLFSLIQLYKIVYRKNNT